MEEAAARDGDRRSSADCSFRTVAALLQKIFFHHPGEQPCA
jgi:hypothetical protein